MEESDYSFDTMAIHAGDIDPALCTTIGTPIYSSVAFSFGSAQEAAMKFSGKEAGYVYSRIGNPTVELVEKRIAALEGGEACLAASSGMGAIGTLFLTILKAGDHIIADKTIYSCTYTLFSTRLAKFGISTSFVDTRNPQEVVDAMRPNTRVVYFETPANPTLKIVDIKSLCETVHSHNNEIMVITDNTFSTPCITKPIALGVDVVVHSGTKYINGHGDALAGFIVGKKDLIDRCYDETMKDVTGAPLQAFEAFLVLRGLKTLPVRVERHSANALKIARYLEKHPKIEKVYYPGLESFEDHEIAAKQMKGGFGGVLAFEVKGGVEAGRKLMNSVRLCHLAVSLGECDTLIEHPASMTHCFNSPEEREKAGISDGLVRLSVGLEDPEDIRKDLDRALENI